MSEGDNCRPAAVQRLRFFEVQQAAAAVGAYGVPLNWHGRTEEAIYVLEDRSRRCWSRMPTFCPDPRARLPAGIRVFVVPTPPEIQQRYGRLDRTRHAGYRATRFGAMGRAFEPLRRRRRACATMIYTSGTTGHPKGVKRQPPRPRKSKVGVELRQRVWAKARHACAILQTRSAHASPNSGTAVRRW